MKNASVNTYRGSYPARNRGPEGPHGPTGRGWVVALLLVALLGGLTQTAASQPLDGQISSLSGWLHTVWGDRPPDTDKPNSSLAAATRYGLVDHEGKWIDIEMDKAAMSVPNGLLTFNRQPVILGGSWQRPLATSDPGQEGGESGFRVRSIQRQSTFQAQSIDAALLEEATVNGSQRWATVLCRFADSTGTTPHPKTWFDTLMLGGSSPGMEHYWQELSYGQINLTGSLVVGWYNLPQPRSYYVYDKNGDGVPDLDHGRAARDCAVAADADVYFPGMIGINLVFNQNLDCCAWGGSWTFTLDGQTKSYNVTWLPPWGYENQGVIGHEMGHGFGLPHSSGPYGDTYDSRWDVMSNIWDNCWPKHPEYGCIGVHTIAYHKDFLGWIASGRRYVASPGDSTTIELERLGQPPGTGYLIAKIPLVGSTTQFYTVEARQTVGYDGTIPGNAAVIHYVDTARWDRVAQVVDTDGNGNPNDAGAMWLPGDTFIDTTNAITVSVISTTATGARVAINYGNSIPQYTLTVTKSGNGAVRSDPLGIDCGVDCHRYESGTAVALAAVADAGWIFSMWSGDADCTDGYVTMTRDLMCTAIFSRGADLTGQFTSLTRTISKGRERLDFRLAIQNRGNQPAAGRFRVAFYLSDNGVFDGTDLPLTTQSVRTQRLAPGGTTSLSGRITLPLPGEGRSILAAIDSSNIVIESDEGNNHVTASIPAMSRRRISKNSRSIGDKGVLPDERSVGGARFILTTNAAFVKAIEGVRQGTPARRPQHRGD